MATKYKTIITSAGAAKLAVAMSAQGKKVDITHMAIGDGGGTLPQPVPGQTKLVREVHRAPLNKITQDPHNEKYVIAELVIPPETGGFWMRESGLYDSEGTLIAVANMAESYKPLLAEGSGRSQTIRMVLIISDVNAVSLTIDSTTVIASKDYVDDALSDHEKSRNHPDGTLLAKGFVQLSSATTSAAEDRAATSKAVKTVMDEANKKAPLASPVLTGKPTAPTAAQTSSDTQIATTAFVKEAVAPALMWRGALPASPNLNNYGPTPTFTGSWGMGASAGAQPANGFPEPNAVGLLEVFAGGQFGGTQRYTVRNGNIYIRSLTAGWNGADGPWGEWSMVGVNPRPGYYDGDMNALLMPGIWSITGVSTNGPVASGLTGVCEVLLRNSTSSVVQRFTTISTNASFMNRAWQRTLSGATWSAWELSGTKALNDLGIGLSNLTALTGFDWQQDDFKTGAMYLINSSAMTNIPDGIKYDPATQIFVSVDGITSSGTVYEMTLTPNTSGDANYRIYKVRVAGSTKGARVFKVRQVFTSVDVLPVTNGGTGSPTADGAIDNLNLRETVNKAAGALQRSGGTMTGPVIHFGGSSCAGAYTVGTLLSNNNVVAGNGALGTNGDINGPIWNGWLSSWLNGQFGVRDNNINARATIDWVYAQFLPRGQDYNTIGTFMMAYFNGGDVNPETVVSGGNLFPSTADGMHAGWSLPGSWRCAGMSRTTNDAHRTALWQRVA